MEGVQETSPDRGALSQRWRGAVCWELAPNEPGTRGGPASYSGQIIQFSLYLGPYPPNEGLIAMSY